MDNSSGWRKDSVDTSARIEPAGFDGRARIWLDVDDIDINHGALASCGGGVRCFRVISVRVNRCESKEADSKTHE